VVRFLLTYVSACRAHLLLTAGIHQSNCGLLYSVYPKEEAPEVTENHFVDFLCSVFENVLAHRIEIHEIARRYANFSSCAGSGRETAFVLIVVQESDITKSCS
jgi:hypothetical protein